MQNHMDESPYVDGFIGAMRTSRWREIFSSETNRECRSGEVRRASRTG